MTSQVFENNVLPSTSGRFHTTKKNITQLCRHHQLKNSPKIQLKIFALFAVHSRLPGCSKSSNKTKIQRR